MLITLVGYKQVGKSKVAEILAAEGFIRMGFVDPAREMLHSLGVPWENITGSKKDEPMAMFNGHSGRYALKMLTTEWGRNLFGEGFWLSRWAERLHQIQAGHISGASRVVVEDMRLYTESIATRQENGFIWRIEREGKGPEIGANAHRTEQEIELIIPDITISNNGTIDDLRQVVLQQLVATPGYARPVKMQPAA